MSNRTFLGSVVVLLAILAYLLLSKPNQGIVTNELPHIKHGLQINLNELTRIDDEPGVISLESDNTGLSAVFIFKPSCFHCEENLFFWKKLKQTLKNQLDAYGVILSETTTESATHFLESKKLNFPLFSPNERDNFMKKFNVKFNLPQTVILKKGVVIYSKAGVLEAKDFFKIKNLTKENLKNET